MDDDAFDGLVLDDAFVAGASRHEGTAAERVARLRRIDAGHRRVRAERAAAAVRGRRTRRRLKVAAAVALVALVGGVVVGVRRDWGGPPPSLALGEAEWSGFERYEGTERPPPAGGTEPVGTPPAVDDDLRHAFLHAQPDGSDPVAYDPCRPVTVVVDDREAPPGAGELLAEAVDALERATGLDVVVEGDTDERPSTSRAPYQPDRYGERWAPVLVSWSAPRALPALDGTVAGIGGSQPVAAADGDLVYVTGVVLLDGPDVGRIAEVEGRAAARSVLLHELGHLVGLAHVQDPTQVMNPVGGEAVAYAEGDRAGLARLGAGECHPDL